MLLSSAINAFLKELQNRPKVSQLTLKNYTIWLKRFLDFASDTEVEKIDERLIKKYKLHLLAWTDHMKGTRLKPITQNYHLIALRALLEYLNGQYPLLSPSLVALVKQPPREMKLLTFEQVRKIAEAPNIDKKEGIRDRCILEVLSCSGMLVSGLVSLNCKDVNIENQQIMSGKIYHLSPQAVKWLETYVKSRKDTFTPLFIRFQGKIDPASNGENARLTARSIERIVEKYGKKVGIIATPQLLRQSLAVSLLQEGQHIKLVQKLLGHQHQSSTRIYLKN